MSKESIKIYDVEFIDGKYVLSIKSAKNWGEENYKVTASGGVSYISAKHQCSLTPEDAWARHVAMLESHIERLSKTLEFNKGNLIEAQVIIDSMKSKG